MDKYTRNDKSDLSGMTPGQLREHLQPKYDGDTDWWNNIKFGLGIPLLVIAFLGCVAGWLFLVGSKLL